MAKQLGVVKVAAVQAAPVAFNLTESLVKVESLTKKAAQDGSDMVVFP
jgi:nitrilase